MTKRRQSTPPAGAPRRRRLSARGRQRFGEFVANGLFGAAALIGSAIVLPGLLEAERLPSELFFGAAAMFAVCVATALAVRYMTEEHEGERT
ncbi:MAG TPA: hypothetical protein VEA80_00345 [Vitreimonas sp.]|nr:hypothetical protein [Vitreimonas sp.]